MTRQQRATWMLVTISIITGVCSFWMGLLIKRLLAQP